MRSDAGHSFAYAGADLAKALARLDPFLRWRIIRPRPPPNRIRLSHLTAAKPDLRILRLPKVDELRRNPYHRLVRHYQDRELKRGRRNDLELDARIALAVELPPCSEAVERRHVRAPLQDINLGFAGRRRAGHPMHGEIASLSIGDPLKVGAVETGCWRLLGSAGRLAKSFEPPPGMQCRPAAVYAAGGWSREASERQYRDAARCDAWEAVVPELVFEAAR